ncbi:DUF2827 family protein [Volucribacter amazonae]|uniref:DUF2827 domain-containing protein n=1 Tax=Volucribacter amazonae TaxID=256731 RepID=A0A9X4P8K2_9PAST|nr:DUF2827 family protein [Volucribacter amazonae]MDG6894635.1 hypothetical protein [Volucribacter amazonae]
MRSGLHIGISFYLDDSFTDIWANGAVQNTIFMYQLFQQMGSVDRVSLAFDGNRTEPPAGLMLDDVDLAFIPLEQAVEEVDVLIEMGLSLSPAITDKMRQRGAKTVSMRVGNDFIMDIERFVFDQPAVRTFNGAQFDAVWTIPQHAESCRSYFSIMLRAPFFVLPQIWSPLFVDKVIKRINGLGIKFGYQSFRDGARISIFEPNITVMKTSHTPILLCEQAYRQNPQAIKHVYACCTYEKRQYPAFHNFIGRTDLVKEGVLTVEGRYQLPDFMARFTDVVVAHQWENALNYVYYETLYGGYPLIHNSELLPVGYYYPSFDALQGANILLNALENHDKYLSIYREQANDLIEKLSPYHRKNIEAHEQALQALFI